LDRHQRASLGLYNLILWADNPKYEKEGKNTAEECEELINIKEVLLRCKKVLWVADTCKTIERVEDRLLKLYIQADALAEKCGVIKEADEHHVEVPDPAKQETSSSESKQIGVGFVESMSCIFKGIGNASWASVLRVGIVIMSGFYLTYLTKPTYGTIQDYFVTFLWGLAADSSLLAISSILGSEKPILTSFKELFS